MTSKAIFVEHTVGGGWATDYGTVANLSVPKDRYAVIPWLNEAQNLIYTLSGGLRKCPGSTLNTSTALESGADIMGVFDAWFSGTAGTPTQRRIMHVGTKIKRDAADDAFVDLFTGMTAGAVPCYSMLEDLLIMSNDSGTDVPKSWDLTTAQNLAGTPPTFAFSCIHKNKVFAAGAVAQPSRLYYSVSLFGSDWVGAGSGNIDIDPDDGDRITAIASHRNELIVFKGPHKGSIHRITGSSSSDFARATLVTGVGAANHRTIVPFANDLGFLWTDGTFRSLAATADFGDYQEKSLSRDIQTWLADHLAISSLRFAQAVNWPALNIVLLALPIDASASNNTLLAMDYRFSPPRWSLWGSYNMVTSLASAVSLASSKARIVLGGGTDGKLRTFGVSSRSIDDVQSIAFKATTPFIDYGLPDRFKTLEGGALGIVPRGSGNITVGWTRDLNAQQTMAIAQGGGVPLGTFVLGTDVFGGPPYSNRFFRCDEAGGSFRAIQYEILNNAAGQDVEIHSLAASITIDAESFEA